MKVPLVDLSANYLSIKDEIDDAVQEVISTTSFIMGPHVEEFDRRWARYCGARFALGVANGTEAVRLAVKACDITDGDEVITVANTFIATTEAIGDNGARPVFVDIHEDSYVMDAEQIARRVTDRTAAIVCVHLYGHPCDMDPIMSLADEKGLMVIEDCAQAHGARYKGRMVGTIGHVGCHSMFPAKILGAFGDAGAVVTDDEIIADRVAKYRNHGRVSKYESVVEGCNARLDALQARILIAKLPHLDGWIDARRRLAARYSERLGDLVRVPTERPFARHPYYMYVIRHERRDDLRDFLADRGISCGIHYPIPLHLQEAYAGLGYGPGDLPATELAAKEILSIPLYPELTQEQQDHVIESIAAFTAREVRG